MVTLIEDIKIFYDAEKERLTIPHLLVFSLFIPGYLLFMTGIKIAEYMDLK